VPRVPGRSCGTFADNIRFRGQPCLNRATTALIKYPVPKISGTPRRTASRFATAILSSGRASCGIFRDHKASRHSKNIPEARIPMIADFPNSEIATGRRIRDYPSRMKTLRNPTQATSHAIPVHGRKYANRPVQLIAGPSHFRAPPTVATRSGTGPAKRRAGRVPSLPFSAIHPLRQPAIPDGGRSGKILCSLGSKRIVQL